MMTTNQQIRKEKTMKKHTTNPYQTNKGGQILAPKKAQDEPRATKTCGDDLRIKKGKAGEGK